MTDSDFTSPSTRTYRYHFTTYSKYDQLPPTPTGAQGTQPRIGPIRNFHTLPLTGPITTVPAIHTHIQSLVLGPRRLLPNSASPSSGLVSFGEIRQLRASSMEIVLSKQGSRRRYIRKGIGGGLDQSPSITSLRSLSKYLSLDLS